MSVYPAGTCQPSPQRKLRDTSWSMRRWWQELRGEVHVKKTHKKPERCFQRTLGLNSASNPSIRDERSSEKEASDEGAPQTRGQHLQRHGGLEHRDPAALGQHVSIKALLFLKRIYVLACRKGEFRCL